MSNRLGAASWRGLGNKGKSHRFCLEIEFRGRKIKIYFEISMTGGGPLAKQERRKAGKKRTEGHSDG